MDQQKIKLRKIRDFGENLSDTFQFIRQEFKPLLTSFVLIAGIFILANAIFSGLYQKQAFGFFDQITKGISSPESVLSLIFSPTYFILLSIIILSLSVMRTVIAVYMKLYDQTSSSPSVQEVWQEFLKYFLRVFLFNIIQGILVLIGLAFCILPGIYVLVVLMPYPFIMVNENLSFRETFNRCNYLIKDNFWITLAIYLVAYLIYSVSSGIIGFSISLIAGLISYFTTKELSSTFAVVISILNVIQYLFFVIFFVSIGLHYYNLTELKDNTGLARRLEDLGSSANINRNIEEEF